MHEFSICEKLVQAVLVELDRTRPRPKRLLKARVVVGRLQQIVPDSLQLAYEILTRETAAEGSALELDEVPIKCECRQCGWEGEINDRLFLCHDCGSAEVNVVAGNELYLESLEIEEDEHDNAQSLP